MSARPETRCLHRPDDVIWPATNVVPRANNRASLDTRNTLAQFLDATMQRPVHFDDNRREAQINQIMNTMTLTERVFIEIEMQSRNATAHSFDYDPLR